MTVCPVDHDHFESRSQTTVCGVREMFDDRIDHLLIHLFNGSDGTAVPGSNHFLHGRRDGRRTYGHRPFVQHISARMVKLYGKLCAIPVYGLNNAAQPVDHLVVPQV